MTPSELSKLTPEQKRVKISEVCKTTGRYYAFHYTGHGNQRVRSFSRTREDAERTRSFHLKFGSPTEIIEGIDLDTTPDYLSDLNAMHASEKTLTDHQYEVFRCELWDLVTDKERPRHNESAPTRFERAFLSSTASQRADAFLLAVCPAS